MPTAAATTVTDVARRYLCDINMGTIAVPNWQPLLGREDFKVAQPRRTVEDESYDDAGAMRMAITGSSWKIETKIIHRRDVTTALFNAAQEYLRTQSLKFDAATAEIHVRWYDAQGRPEAFDGMALVEWSPDGGKAADRDLVKVVLTGQGAETAITNPLNTTPLPIVSAVAPTSGTTAGGTLVTITGAYFTAASAVAFGVTAAPSFTVISSTKISVISPARAAGSIQVKVTTPNGASADTPADDYLYV